MPVLYRDNKKHLFVSQSLLEQSHSWRPTDESQQSLDVMKGSPHPPDYVWKWSFHPSPILAHGVTWLSASPCQTLKVARENTERALEWSWKPKQSCLVQLGSLCFLMCHHRPLQNLHPVSPLISLVWKPPHRSETHHRPPTDGLVAKDAITSSLPHALLSKKALFKWGNYRRRCVPRAVGLFCEVHSGNSTKHTDLSTFLRNKMEF